MKSGHRSLLKPALAIDDMDDILIAIQFKYRVMKANYELKYFTIG